MLKTYNKYLSMALICGAISGCSTTYAPPDSQATDKATEQFRENILKLSKLTIQNAKHANEIISVNHSETEVLDDPNLGGLLNVENLGYLNGVYTSSFKTLVTKIANLSGYSLTITTVNKTILEKNITINGDNIRLIDALYSAESMFGEDTLDITINTNTKRIVVGDFHTDDNRMRSLKTETAIIRSGG